MEPVLDGDATTLSKEEEITITSQFSYTYKFRSLKGATEYHHEHVDLPGHHAVHGEEEESNTSDRPTAMLLPGTALRVGMVDDRCIRKDMV